MLNKFYILLLISFFGNLLLFAKVILSAGKKNRFGKYRVYLYYIGHGQTRLLSSLKCISFFYIPKNYSRGGMDVPN